MPPRHNPVRRGGRSLICANSRNPSSGETFDPKIVAPITSFSWPLSGMYRTLLTTSREESSAHTVPTTKQAKTKSRRHFRVFMVFGTERYSSLCIQCYLIHRSERAKREKYQPDDIGRQGPQ